MTNENKALEEVINHAYIGSQGDKVKIVIRTDMNRVHYFEYLLSTGERLTEWRVPLSDFQGNANRVITKKDLKSIPKKSELYSELSNRALMPKHGILDYLLGLFG